jgi:hypothetical protein
VTFSCRRRGCSTQRAICPFLIKDGRDAARPIGEKRPADVIGAAIFVAKIATGEAEDAPSDDGKNPAAKALGSAPQR